MATPFKVFRDNQKILMVVFGALLMVAFIILPPLVQFGFTNRQIEVDKGEVVVVVGEEELRIEDVRELSNKYNLVARVMTAAMQQCMQLQGTPNPPMPPIPGLQIQQPTQRNPGGPVYTPVQAEVAVRFHAWAKKADEMGLVIDDAAVREFLSETAGGRLSDYDYDALLGYVVGKDNPLITYDYFFEMVRDVLKAQKIQALVIRDGRVVTPSSAWVAYRNMNRTISVEMFPIAASNFMSKVGKPSEAQIKELFDKYRLQARNPMANQIGFRQMDKIALAYVKGDIANFVEAAKSQITDEQVATYYEENKDSYRKPTLPSAEPGKPASGGETAPMETTETPAEGEKPAEGDKSAEGDKPMEEAQPEPMTEPAEEKPASEPSEKPAEEPKPEEPKSDESKAETPKEEQPQPEDSSLNQPSSSKVQLVSFLQEEGEQPQPEEPAKPAQEDAKEAAVVEDPMDDAAPETQPGPASAEGTAPTDSGAPAEGIPMAEGPVEYKPLAEVQDQIRTRLAQPIAQKAMNEALSEIRGELQLQYENYRYSQSDEDFDATQSPYDSNALETMATKLGLTFGAMPLMDIYSASETDLARDATHMEIVPDPVRVLRQENRSMVAEAFQFGTPLFQPRLFPGASQNQRFQSEPDVQYVYWKTEQKDGFIPTLDDVRDEVIQTWKQLEAQKLAKAEAEQIADLVKSKEALAEAAKTHDSVTPIVAENITYFNQLSGQQGLTLGDIPGVPPEEISQEMMEALFSTPVGESTVAPNLKQTVYYVAFVTGESETNAELRQNLLDVTQGTLPQSVLMYSSQEENMVTSVILQDYFDPSHIEWMVDPMNLDSGS